MQRHQLKVSMFEIYIQTSASLISFGFGVNPHVKNMNHLMFLWVLVLQRKTSKNGYNCIEWNLQVGILKNPWLARIFWKKYTLHTAKLFCSKIYWILYTELFFWSLFYISTELYFFFFFSFFPEIKEKDKKKGQLPF